MRIGFTRRELTPAFVLQVTFPRAPLSWWPYLYAQVWRWSLNFFSPFTEIEIAWEEGECDAVGIRDANHNEP